MSETLRRIERLRRELAGLPVELRSACWSDGERLWVRIHKRDGIGPQNLRALAEAGYSLEVLPTETFDIAKSLNILSPFAGLRLAGDDESLYLNLEMVGNLSRLQRLHVDFPTSRDINLSTLSSLESLAWRGDGALSAFDLPRLTHLRLAMNQIPEGSRITSPIEHLGLDIPSIEDLDFVGNPDLVNTLGVTSDRFDLRWIDNFSGLLQLSLGTMSLLVVDPGSAALNRPTGFVLNDVRTVRGAELFALLPPGGYLNVQRNYSFPPGVQDQFADRGWFIAPYAAPNADIGIGPTAAEADGVTYFPFVLKSDSASSELEFNSWSIFDPLVDSSGSDPNATMERAMLYAANLVGVPSELDSEADAVRLLFQSPSDARRVAEHLRDLWRKSPQELIKIAG